MKRPGLTLIELLITLVIMVIITAAVLGVLEHARAQSIYMTEEMTRLASIQHCLNLIVDDITSAATKHFKLEVQNHTLADGRRTARLTITTSSLPDQPRPDVRIDWIAAPRFEEEDLVLFRREERITGGNKHYIPLCENISSFDIVRLAADGQPSRNDELPLVEISALMYHPGPPDPQRVFPVRRTFCSLRFIGARPIITRPTIR